MGHDGEVWVTVTIVQSAHKLFQVRTVLRRTVGPGQC